MKHLFMSIALLVSLSLMGCSGNVPLGGRVTFEDNGSPDIIGRKETPLIAAKYANADTSGLTFTVDGKANTFDIKGERAPVKK
jgi:hypothetical protein